MKRRVKIIIGILILVVVINVGVIISLAFRGVLDNADVRKSNLAQGQSVVEREEVAKNRTLKLAGEEKKLTYENSRKLSQDQVIDVYRDEKNVEYRFEGERLVAVVDQSVFNQGYKSKGAVSRDESIELAKKHLIEVYGEDLEGYMMDEVQRDGSSIHIIFTKEREKTEFAGGASIRVSMTTDGTVYQSMLPYEKYLNFNEILLNGITKKDIEKFVEEQVKERYGDRVRTWEIDGDGVVTQVNGKYCLEIGVILTMPRNVDGMEYELEIAELFYYALE